MKFLFTPLYGLNRKKLLKLLKDKKDSIAKINKQIKQAERDKDSEKIEYLNNKKQELGENFDEQIEFTKESLSDSYLLQYKKVLSDYPIFMAIAEDIGYDATGKETGRNELPEISIELARFIKTIEEGNDHFF